MSPQPPGSEAAALEAVAGLLADCGLGRAADVVREESRGQRSAGRGAACPPGFAAGLRRLAATLGDEASATDGEGREALGKENLGPRGHPNEEPWLDSLLETLVTCTAQAAVAEGGQEALQATAAELEKSAAAAVEAPAAPAGQPPPPPVQPPPPPPPSESYRADRPGAPLSDGTNDEYRDDGDPGYRVLQQSEVELVRELQELYRAPLSALLPTSSPQAPATADGTAEPSSFSGSLQQPSGEADCADAGSGLAATAAAALAAAGGGEGAAAAAAQEPASGGAALSTAAQAAALEAAMWAAAQPQPQPQPRPEEQQQQAAAGGAWQSAAPRALATSRKAQGAGKRPAYRYAPSGDAFYPAEYDGVIYDSFPLRVVYERDRTGFEESKEFPIQINSIIAARYQVLQYLGSAAFSRAVQCLDLQTNEMVCMKIIKNDKDFIDQSLDEIKLLKIINANTGNVDEMHCLRLIDYIYHKEHLIIITELLRDNLYEFSKWNRDCGPEPYFTLGHLQRITKQLLTALRYVHGLWLIHADLKPENVLIKSYSRCEVKLIDFGSSCFVDDRLSSYVQSRSYRAPEVILGLPYDQKVDIWSLGCVLAELWTGYVLFQNDSVQSLLARVVGIIGQIPRHMMSAGRFVKDHFTQDGRLFREVAVSPAEAELPLEQQPRIQLLLPKRSSLRQRMRTDDEEFVDFLSCLLRIDPAERPTAAEALEHKWLAPGRYSDGL